MPFHLATTQYLFLDHLLMFAQFERSFAPGLSPRLKKTLNICSFHHSFNWQCQ